MASFTRERGSSLHQYLQIKKVKLRNFFATRFRNLIDDDIVLFDVLIVQNCISVLMSEWCLTIYSTVPRYRTRLPRILVIAPRDWDLHPSPSSSCNVQCSIFFREESKNRIRLKFERGTWCFDACCQRSILLNNTVKRRQGVCCLQYGSE